jgi:exonuclease SbcD
LLLISGDVFDTGTPTPQAEGLVFRFFKRIGRAGIPSVVIAGNHDSPSRVEAWGSLAELVDVHAVAWPRPHDKGGVIRLRSRAGETALVAAVPFASPQTLLSALERAEDDTLAKQRYADGMRAIVENVSRPFGAETVNLLMLHTHLEGALFSGSERSVHLGEEWAAAPQALPASAHYVALGHIHKPQRVDSAPAPAYYAGSVLQMDFGEAGEEKGFVLVDARPRQPVRCERVPYRGGKPLHHVRRTLAELEAEASQLASSGWLRVTVPLSRPDPDINTRVRKLVPNALRVDVELPQQPALVEARPVRGNDPVQLYEAYCAARQGKPPEDEVVEAFRALLAAESEA